MGDGDPYRTHERGIADVGDMLIPRFCDPDHQVISVFQLKAAAPTSMPAR